MNASGLETKLRALLGSVAPGAGAESVPLEADLRFELDLDSMDWLEFCLAIEREWKVAVPESDYTRLASLSSCLEYLESHRR